MSAFPSAFASKRSSSSGFESSAMPPRASSWRSGGAGGPSKEPPAPSVKSFKDFPALGGSKKVAVIMPAATAVMDFKAAALLAPKAAPPPPAEEEYAPAAEEPYQFPSYFSTGRNRIFTEAEAEMIEHTPAHLRERRIAMLRSGTLTCDSRSLSAIGTRCYDDGPEDYDGPEEDEEEGEEESEFNANLTSDRRRGDKGVW